jgi:lipopolysaccharide biosynthesis glycosyltransferase
MSTVQVALASDERYFPGLLTTITSIVCSTAPDTPIRFVVLDGGLTEKAWQKLETTARMYNWHVEFRAIARF